MVTLTAEQQDIIDTVVNANPGSIIKVEAVAGSSKTFTSVKVAEALGESQILYLAYNKAIATEASAAFPRYVECKTTHSLAYAPTIVHKLNLDGTQSRKRHVGFFGHRDIKEKIPYDLKLTIIDLLEAFFLSKYLTTKEFLAEAGVEESVASIIDHYFNAMLDGTIPCTHACYLKQYHLLLANDMVHYDNPYKLIILDEAGDINPVTLEILLLLPADIKLIVGDSLQNIYSFNHTINGFKELEGIGITKHLSKSFRCSESIANRVSHFIHTTIGNEDTVFTGTSAVEPSYPTNAFISRYNSTLIDKIVDLSKNGTNFRLLRNPSDLFKAVLVLMNLSKGELIPDPRYKHLRDEYDFYQENPEVQREYSNVLTYIKAMNEEIDKNISSAAKILLKYGSSVIYKAYKTAKAHYSSSNEAPGTLVLTTAHSSKGMTFTNVELADDFPIDDISKLEVYDRNNEEDEELRLYYVACTRASHRLTNAIYL